MIDWLHWFLSQPGMEAAIDLHLAHHSPADGTMHVRVRCLLLVYPDHCLPKDVWDSPFWNEQDAFVRSSGSLVFTFFMDWFNLI